MNKILILLTSCVFALFSRNVVKADENLEKYLDLLNKGELGPKGSYKSGEIQIIDTTKQILEAQELQKRKFKRLGLTDEQAENGAEIGIIAEDVYWVLIRDAVIFPTGMIGSYNRLVKKSKLENKFSGAAVIPVLKNKKVLLIVNYRHATRAWELEVPRGYSEKGESEVDTARRELSEETGLTGENFTRLGYMNPDSGSVSSCIPIFLATIKDQKGFRNPDDSEAIVALKTFTVDELKKALVDGSFMMKLSGREQKVFVRDSFIAFSILLAQERGLL